MKIHEYQGKQLFAKYGVAVPQGIACFTVDEAEKAAEKIIAGTGSPVVVVKAQIHAGGRGKGGGEIVGLMGTSAYYAPAYSAVVMAEAYLLDQKRVLPAAAYLDGEYGYKDLYLGVPVVIGAGGVEKILKIELTAAETAMLKTSADSVQKVVDIVKAKA